VYRSDLSFFSRGSGNSKWVIFEAVVVVDANDGTVRGGVSEWDGGGRAN